MKKKVIYLAVLLSLATSAGAAEDKHSDAPAKASRAAAKLWSWQPVQAPATPQVKQNKWVRTPIDAFVLARLESKGVKPSQDADRAAFIRRATLDVWGIIPSPEDVKAFVVDRSPDAYEKLVDRLLSSQHYGERQARRWLDLARYADSTGFQNDNTRPNMWRYRDYVIGAFNQDKPYDQFVKEQLAGDEIAPNDQNALIATGFLIGYPDNYNSRDLVQRQYQIETDMTDTVGLALLGQTVGCARCHNHKTDKVTQKDYFSLQAFFANTSVDEKIAPKEKGEQEKKYEEAQAKYQAATKDIVAQQKAILDIYREAGLKYHKERYLTDSREAIFKPEAQWTPLDRWVNHRLANVTTDQDIASFIKVVAEDKKHPQYTQEIALKWAEYEKLTTQLKTFDNLKPASGSKWISAVTELGHPDSPPTHIRFTGVHERPLDEVQPAFPAALTDEKPNIVPSATSSGRRTALANWIASPKNPLTSRVFVNRVWAQYFGTGIVKTISDFGKAGDKPVNPELLDYLANNFVNEGWSVKKLHRQILLSSVYRQSSAHRADVYKADPDNLLLAVFPRKRLEAEEIRDSLLVASGQLVDKIGGPSVFPPLPSNATIGVDFNDNPSWVVSKDVNDHNRRSLYVFTRRSLPYSMLEVFDPANPQLVHSKRDVTTTPLQALTLFNSEIVFGWSQALAGRVINEAGNNEMAQVDRLYQILFARNADKSEKAALHDFLGKQEKIIQGKTADGKFVLSVPTGLKSAQVQNPIRLAAFVDLVHTVANSNEFAYRF